LLTSAKELEYKNYDFTELEFINRLDALMESSERIVDQLYTKAERGVSSLNAPNVANVVSNMKTEVNSAINKVKTAVKISDVSETENSIIRGLEEMKLVGKLQFALIDTPLIDTFCDFLSNFEKVRLKTLLKLQIIPN